VLNTDYTEGIRLIFRLKPLLEAEIIVFVPSADAVAYFNIDPAVINVINVSNSRFLQANVGRVLCTAIKAGVSLLLIFIHHVDLFFFAHA